MTEQVLDPEDTDQATLINTIPPWVGPAFAVLAFGTAPWVVLLAARLPRHTTFTNYRTAWVGYDVGLMGALASTGYLAWRGRPQVALTSTVTATMLVVDAWFDVLTSAAGPARRQALALAGLVELPLAGACLWIARHAGQVIEHRAAALARRARRAEARATRQAQERDARRRRPAVRAGW